MSARNSKATPTNKTGPTRGDGHEVRVGRATAARPQREVGKLKQTLTITTFIAQQRYASKRQASRTSSSQKQAARQLQRASQRATVRITYSAPKTAQHWRSHGVYIQREAAVANGEALFGNDGVETDTARTLDDWQKAGDKRLFRLIISPENGSNLDMRRLTEDTMRRLEKQLDAKLEWTAAVHTNTDHPHVHVALRGVTQEGKQLVIPKDVVRTKLRAMIEEEATAQLGFRTDQEIDAATISEAYKQRVTSLDKAIAANGAKNEKHISFDTESEYMKKISLRQPVRALAIARRLDTLEQMGMAERTSGSQWRISASFMSDIKALAQAGDKQRMLSRHMAPASSIGQEIQTGNWNQINNLNARVLGHDEDEQSGKRYMLIESTDGRILQLPHRKDIEAMRQEGKLKRDELITIGRYHGKLTIKEHGNAYQAINDPYVIDKMRDDYTGKNVRDGWLAKFDEAAQTKHVVFTASQLETVLGSAPNRSREEQDTTHRLIVAKQAVPLDDENFARYSETEKGYVVTAPAVSVRSMVQVVQVERTKTQREKENELERDI